MQNIKIFFQNRFIDPRGVLNNPRYLVNNPRYLVNDPRYLVNTASTLKTETEIDFVLGLTNRFQFSKISRLLRFLFLPGDC